MDNDIGKLFLFNSFFSPPDIIFDGVRPTKTNREICITNNGDDVVFMDLDASNDFKGLSKDISKFYCDGFIFSKP